MLHLLGRELTVEASNSSLEILLVLCQALLLALNHTKCVVLVGQGLVLPVDFVLQVGDVVRCDLELAFELDDLVLCLDAVLGVQVTFGSDSLVQVLLLLHLGLVLHVLFLQLGDEVLLKLDFLDHLHQVSVSFVSILRVAVPLLLDL